MTNYPFKEIEQKEFNLKFSFEMLTSTIMFIQKVKSLYPGENNPVNINCTNLEDEIVDQLIEEEMKLMQKFGGDDLMKQVSQMEQLNIPMRLRNKENLKKVFLNFLVSNINLKKKRRKKQYE